MTDSCSMGKIIFLASSAVCIIILMIYYMRSKKPFPSALKGMLSGGLSLAAVHFFGGYAGLYLPVNFFTCAASLILGMPAVIIMTAAEKFGLI